MPINFSFQNSRDKKFKTQLEQFDEAMKKPSRVRSGTGFGKRKRKVKRTK